MTRTQEPLRSDNHPFQYSFVPGEIISRGTPLSILCTKRVELEPSTAPHSIIVHQRQQQSQASVSVTHSDKGDGSTIHISTENLKYGCHSIAIPPLACADGTALCEATSIPVTVGAIRGVIPPHLRVEHVVHAGLSDYGCVRLKPGSAAPSKCTYIEFVKCVDRETCRVETLAFDESGSQVDGGAHLAAISKRRYEEFGNLHPEVKSLCDAKGEAAPVDVVIVPRIRECSSEFVKWEKDTEKPAAAPPAQELQYFKKVQEARAKAISALGDNATIEKIADGDASFKSYFINARLTTKELKGLAKSDVIGGIFLKNDTAIPDLANSMAISKATEAQAAPLGYTGQNVNVGLYEDGPFDTNQLEYASQYSADPPKSEHARLTSAIIKNRQTVGPYGYAPNCNLHSANSGNLEAVLWAAQTKLCTVISQSFHRQTGFDPFDEQTVGTLSFDDIYKDWLAVHYPYPTIVHAAGNDASQVEFVNHKGFNTINVGSHSDDGKTMSVFTDFKNPVSPHMDRELPELSANGEIVTAAGVSLSGTSFSAPAVAGTVALMQEAAPLLKSWPEACRAILFASCDRNIRGGTWWADVSSGVDAWDGSGALNARGACEIAKTQQQPGNEPAYTGWNVHNLSTADMGPDSLSVFRYKILVPDSPFSLWRYTVKVALAFSTTVTPEATIPMWGGTSAPFTTSTSDLDVNLDLIVRDSLGNQVANSSSFDNSYEICEFTGRRGQTYEVIVRRNSGTRNVFMGLAWGISSKLLVLGPIEPPISIPDVPIPGGPGPDPGPELTAGGISGGG